MTSGFPQARRAPAFYTELLAMLPGWADEKFWDQVDEITGGLSARATMNALLMSATYPAADGTYFTSLRSAADEVLERYPQPSYREQLASLIGAELIRWTPVTT